MHCVVSKKWDASILDSISLITSGTGLMSTFDLNSGNIMKLIKDYDEVASDNSLYIYYLSLEELDKKINYLKLIDI